MGFSALSHGKRNIIAGDFLEIQSISTEARGSTDIECLSRETSLTAVCDSNSLKPGLELTLREAEEG
jgi:hypothetical protein